MAPKGESRREDILAGRGGGQFYKELEAGTVNAVFVRRIHDLKTGRIWDRVFLFPVEGPEDFEAAEAWLNKNYPLTKEGE